MAERLIDEEVTVARRGPGWRRIASFAALAILLLLVVAIAVVWIERRPIATQYLKREFERRGVTATYTLDRVGLRTQQVSNLVIGDPRRPDLVARYAKIQMRLQWDGSFEVYRIVARGVRLRGRLVHGKVSWGQVDKLLPPPSNKPFQLPNFALDIADASIALSTPFGPIGAALEGHGQLSGGFKGRLALASPRLVPGRCGAENLRANVAVAVIARRPNVEGPVTLNRFACPLSRFEIIKPRFDAKASFNEAFTSVNGSGRMAIEAMAAGANGLANFAGELTYKGTLTDVRGAVKLSAQRSRLGTIYADRTRLNGGYGLDSRAGKFALVGDYAAEVRASRPRCSPGSRSRWPPRPRRRSARSRKASATRSPAPRATSIPPAPSASSISRAAERRASRAPTSSVPAARGPGSPAAAA